MGRWQYTIYLLRPLAVKLMTRRGLILVAILTYGLAVAFDPRPEPLVGDEPIRETLNLSSHLITDETQLSQAPDIYINWKEQTVASGDNLSRLFYRAGLNDLDVYRVSNAKQGKSLRNLLPGEVLRFGIDSEGKLIEMRYERSALEAYVFSVRGNQFVSEHIIREPEVLKSYREGTIKESLYLAGKRANIPDKTVMELANIFGWDIDFVFDIRKGDSFAVLFEERYIDGVRLGTGNILAASFTNRGKTYKAVRYTNSQGQTNYYTPDGLSMRKAFLRTPLDIFRISSGFNLRRKHPIHKKIKAHRGVDYAAPTGTPVYSSGDGRVLEAGYTKANGNYVFIQHGQTYITKYIHLHRKKVRTGQSVKQRQVIGTVGATGYATGPHLHYEFLVNGVHRNPRTVSLPKANPIPKAEKSRFNSMALALLEQLTANQQATQLANNR
ncbi:MAG: peptidoglycan DD-metalloendopeptidase family protein [Porticoccaceae bacterium]